MKKNETTIETPVVEGGKVPVYVIGEGNSAFVEGALNGVNFRLPTNRIVEVPEEIALILEESRKGLIDSEYALESFSRNGGRKIG